MLLVLIGLSLAGCGEYGQVEQGRVVKYDKSTTPPTVWIIKDSGIVDRKPEYTVVPAHAFTIPTEPAEMGQEPHVGLRVNLDVEKKIITMYNFAKGDFDKLSFELVERHDGVHPRKRHPLVWDATTGKERPFPVVKPEERTMTIFSRRQEMLVTIKLSEGDFAKYTGEDWDAGDEVRIYYKEPGKSIRFMNVTRTDVTRR
jgi:hypothetical protein